MSGPPAPPSASTSSPPPRRYEVLYYRRSKKVHKARGVSRLDGVLTVSAPPACLATLADAAGPMSSCDDDEEDEDEDKDEDEDELKVSAADEELQEWLARGSRPLAGSAPAV